MTTMSLPNCTCALSEDREIPAEWLVEYFDDDGADYITVVYSQGALRNGSELSRQHVAWKETAGHST
jgi:hypothetical protein